ncbi:hypothetical protein NQZ68_024499, partial [Dissostichus eleginoides]
MFSVLVTILAVAVVVLGVTANSSKEELQCCGATGKPSLDFAKETCPDPDSFLDPFTMDACPGVIVDVFINKAPLVMGLFVGTGVILVGVLLALICSSTLAKKLKTPSSPQYIILTQPPPSHLEYIPTSTSYSFPEQKPVVFTPLTVANIPIVVALVCSIVLLIQTKREQQEITARYTTLQQEVIKPSNQFCPANPSSAGRATNVKLRVATNVSCYASSDTYHKQFQLNFSSQLDHLPC